MNPNAPKGHPELNRYIKATGEAAELCTKVEDWIADHGGVAPDEVNQLHVNHMRQVVNALRHIAEAIEVWATAPQVDVPVTVSEPKPRSKVVPESAPTQVQYEPDGDALWLTEPSKTRKSKP